MHPASIALGEGPLLAHLDEVGRVSVSKEPPEAPASGGLSHAVWHGAMPHAIDVGTCLVLLDRAFNQELDIDATRLVDIVLGLQVTA